MHNTENKTEQKDSNQNLEVISGGPVGCEKFSPHVAPMVNCSYVTITYHETGKQNFEN